MTQDSRFWNGIVTGDAGPYSFENMNEIFRYGIGGDGTFSGVYVGSGAGGYDGLAVTENGPAAANVVVHSGAALVHGTFYKSSASEVLSIAANGSGNPRIDCIVLTKLWATQTVRLEVLQGTPAGSPVAPSLTQTDGFKWQFKLADVAVANGFATIVNANITDRSFSVFPKRIYRFFVGSVAASDTLTDIDTTTNVTINIQSTKVKFTFSVEFELITPASSYMYYNVLNDELGEYESLAFPWPTSARFGNLSVTGMFTGLTPGSQVFRLQHKVLTGFTGNTQVVSFIVEEIRD